MKKNKIIVIGGKGGAVVVAEQIIDASRRGADIELLGYAFDDKSFGDNINGIPIVCETREASEKFSGYDDVKFIFQLYRPDLMNERVDLLNSYGIDSHRFYTFIHPMAVVAQSAKIGVGSSILANAVINSNATVGNHCTIHVGSLLGHDSKMGDYNFVAANVMIGSNTSIGEKNFFGLNSTFNNYLTIGDNCFVGMASNVVKSLSSGLKVYGNPAREFNKTIKPL